MTKLLIILFPLLLNIAFASSCREYQADLRKIKERHSCLGKSIHLTFDDGPHIKFTKKIMNSLERNNVPATFFVSTFQFDREYLKHLEKEYIKKHTSKPLPAESTLNKRFDNHIQIRKKLLQEMIAHKGFAIASHAHTHDAHDIRIAHGEEQKHYEEDESFEQIVKSMDILDKYTDGKFSEQKNPLIRFPYARGASPSAQEFELIKTDLGMPEDSTLEDYIQSYSHAMRNASKAGLSHLRWNHDSKDSSGRYNRRNSDEYISQFLNSLCSSKEKNIVSLLHDIQQVNTLPSQYNQDESVMDEIIKKAKCLGVDFVSKDEILSRKLPLKVYSPKEKIVHDDLDVLVNLLQKDQVHPNVMKIKCGQEDIDEEKEIAKNTCFSKNLGSEFPTCGGKGSICFESKWYPRSLIENPRNPIHRRIAKQCGINLPKDCFKNKKIINHCDLANEINERICFDGEWREKIMFESFCSL